MPGREHGYSLQRPRKAHSEEPMPAGEKLPSSAAQLSPENTGEHGRQHCLARAKLPDPPIRSAMIHTGLIKKGLHNKIKESMCEDAWP